MSNTKEHHHHHHQVSGKNLGWSIFLNVAITVAEAIGGIISGSMALLSDATHNFSDVISLVVSYIANKLTKKSHRKPNLWLQTLRDSRRIYQFGHANGSGHFYFL
jgi:Co/Zn/Cd efflux system component